MTCPRMPSNTSPSCIPGVTKVQRRALTNSQPTESSTSADLHFVEREAYAADLRSLAGEPLSEAIIDRRYAQLLDEVELVQAQQLAILRCIIQHYGLKRIHVEGLNSAGPSCVQRQGVRALGKVGSQIAGLRKQRDGAGYRRPTGTSEAQRIIEGIEKVEAEYRRDLLRISVAGQLLLNGEIDAVLPLEDEAAYRAADPVDSNGAVTH